jgi:hypothetical protein
MSNFSRIMTRVGVGAGLVLGSLSACKPSPPAQSSAPGMSEGEEQPATQGPACGKVTCAVGEVCCNPSCSVCTPPDGMCTQQLCMDDAQRSAIEAQSGQNESGEPAAEAAPEGQGEGAHATCANVRCMAGTHCEMVQVQCVRAPCPPACGKNTCSTGQTCCNASCGICTEPGQGCIKMLCTEGQMPTR